MSEYNFTFDWNRISTLGKVKVLVEQVVGAPSQEAINTAVADYIEAHPGSLSPLSPDVKSALLQIAEKVAYVDEHGEDYYDALDAALNAKALLQITAVYTQSGTVYHTDSLNSLKADLVVTAYYDDGTTANVTALCTLSGTLTVGTSTITATYDGKSATFDVTVSRTVLYTLPSATTFTGSNHVDTGVKLLQTDHDFTIVADYLNGSFVSNSMLFDCRNYTGKYYGCGVYERASNIYTYTGFISPNVDTEYSTDSGKHLRVVFRHKASDHSWYMDGLVDGVRKAQSIQYSTKEVESITKNLWIGDDSDSNTSGRGWHGTMNTFVVYEGFMSETEVTDWLGE